MPFVKDDPRINREGRPKGSLDRPWLKPQYWHDLLIAEWESLEPKDRASIAMKGFACVIPKVLGPTTPEESLEASESAFKMLKMLEEVSRGIVSETRGRSDTVGVDKGATLLQAEGPATPSV